MPRKNPAVDPNDPTTWPMEHRWLSEPNFERWHEYGLPCLVVRLHNGGTLNGYVGVHPDVDVHAVDDVDRRWPELTYSAKITASSHFVYTVLQPDFIGKRIVGFDTNHVDDYEPFRKEPHDTAPWRGKSYKNFENVRAAVCALAKALYEVSG